MNDQAPNDRLLPALIRAEALAAEAAEENDQRHTAENDAPAACGCWRCLEERGERIWFMVVCATCGNKRCPHAADHDLACTGSNDVGQAGSAYEQGSGAATARRMTTHIPPVGTQP